MMLLTFICWGIVLILYFQTSGAVIPFKCAGDFFSRLNSEYPAYPLAVSPVVYNFLFKPTGEQQ